MRIWVELYFSEVEHPLGIKLHHQRLQRVKAGTYYQTARSEMHIAYTHFTRPGI